MSSVFSMEPEGMTKFWARKVRINRPTTSTEQMLATASSGVSSTRSGGLAAGRFSAGELEGCCLLMRGLFFSGQWSVNSGQ